MKICIWKGLFAVYLIAIIGSLLLYGDDFLIPEVTMVTTPSLLLKLLSFVALICCGLLYSRFFVASFIYLFGYFICIYAHNPFLTSPESGLIGLVLISSGLLGWEINAASWSDVFKNKKIQTYQLGIHMALSVMYMTVLYLKLQDSAWRSGEALYAIYKVNPWVFSKLAKAMLLSIESKELALAILGWFTLAFYMLFPLGLISRQGIRFANLCAVIFHFGLYLSLSLKQVNFGMILVHWFLVISWKDKKT